MAASLGASAAGVGRPIQSRGGGILSSDKMNRTIGVAAPGPQKPRVSLTFDTAGHGRDGLRSCRLYSSLVNKNGLRSLGREIIVSRSPVPVRRQSLVVHAKRGDDDSIDATQRIIAASGYFLPLLDGIRFGRYLYLQYPFFRLILDPVVPLVQLYNGIPFAGFIAFFVLYLAVIQNQSMSRYVRYNCMQAVILDILMILPSLFERVFSFKDGVGFQLTIVLYNTVFLYLLACFIFGVGSCLLGKSPRLPLVADAAEAQVPF